MAKMASEGDGGGIVQSGREITAGEVEQIRMTVELRNLSDIEDRRQAKKVKHQLSALLLYGILMFVYQMASRREATRKRAWTGRGGSTTARSGIHGLPGRAGAKPHDDSPSGGCAACGRESGRR